jgi:hypothetical protein
MVSNLSLAPVFLQSLHLFWIGSAVAESQIDGDQLGMHNGEDCTLTPTSQLQSFKTRVYGEIVLMGLSAFGNFAP